MHHFQLRFLGLVAATAALAIAPLVAQATIVASGATLYTNLLTGSTPSFGGSAGPYSELAPTSLAIDGGVGPYGHSNGTLFTSGPNGTAYMEFAQSSAFTARTFLTQQSPDHPTFSGSAPYQLATANGPGPLVDVTGHHGAGVAGTSSFVITTVDTPVTATRARITFEQGVTGSGFVYYPFHEVIAVSDKLIRVAISSATASSHYLGSSAYVPSNAFDNQEVNGWAAQEFDSDATLTLTLTEPTHLNAIWVTGVDGRAEKFNLTFLDSSLVTVATVTGVEWSGGWNSALLRLDAPALDVKYITLTTDDRGAIHYFGEVIPFQIPEPASAGVLVFAGCFLLNNRGRRRTR